VRLASQSESARADLQNNFGHFGKRKRELDAEVAGLRARGNRNGPGQWRPIPAGGAALGGPGRLTGAPGMNNLAALLENPEFQQLWNSQQKLALDSVQFPVPKGST